MTNQTPSILVVDDERDICANMADILSDLGFHVDVAHDGETALELVRRRPYDLTLLDLKMPGMDGLTLYRLIKKVRAGTVAMLLTAYAGSSTSDEALAAGMLQVLPKPVDLPRLMGLVNEALEQPLLLIVDDDVDLCNNLWDLLHERGYRVCIAHNARGAAERVRGSTRVVLLDLKLPDRDGGEVLRELRMANPDVRAVLITGYRAETETMSERLRAQGADAVCYKPFNIPGLLETVARLAKG